MPHEPNEPKPIPHSILQPNLPAAHPFSDGRRTCVLRDLLGVHQLPAQTLINVNTAAQPILDNTLSVPLQWLGFLAALPVILSLIYGLVNIDRLFRYYQQGIIFSYQQVRLFKHIAKALLLWVVTSMLYESAKSVVFTWQIPPGERLLTVGFGSAD